MTINMPNLITGCINLEANYYDLFFTSESKTVNLLQYDSNGVLQTYQVQNVIANPSLATLGTTDPSASSALGSLYANTKTRNLFIKATETAETAVWVNITPTTYKIHRESFNVTTETKSVTLKYEVPSITNTLLYMNGTYLSMATYTLGTDGRTITFNTTAPANGILEVRSTFNEISLSTISQNISELLTNSVNIVDKYYDMFFNETPMYVELQQYNSDGILETHYVPNRAMNQTVALSGTVDPEDNVEGSLGQLYVNTVSREAFLKTIPTGRTGWLNITPGRMYVVRETFSVDSSTSSVTLTHAVESKDHTMLFFNTNYVDVSNYSVNNSTVTFLVPFASAGTLEVRYFINLVVADSTIVTTAQGYANEAKQYRDEVIAAQISSIQVGTVETLAYGEDAYVVNTGTASNQVWDMGIPTGPQGAQGIQGPKGDTVVTATVGTTTTLPSSSTATVTNTGTNTELVLNFGIPQGVKGVSGVYVGSATPTNDYDVWIDETGTGWNITTADFASGVVVSSFNVLTSDLRIPTEKLVKDSLDAKQDTLVSGSNIKTINNNSVLGSGDMQVANTSLGNLDTTGQAVIDGKANVSLGNLDTTGQEILDNKLNKQQITNCILNDPQNIKLELNNGTLTLKAGSVVCVPNGFESDGTTPKFDEVTVASDISTTYSDGSQYVFYTKNNGTGFGVNQLSTCNSGATDTGVSWHLWYDTANNIIQRKNGTTVIENNCSFPVCIYYGTSSTITSIDQTFQSIGYIGSTVFVRKGLKVLIPDGRNADGSLKNVEYTTDKTHAFTDNSSTVDRCIYLKNWGNYLETYSRTYDKPTFGYAYYSEKENKSYLSLVVSPICCIGSLKRTSGVISNFQPYTATNILKYSDKSQISGWGMPSSRYIDFTFVHGATLIAPANGYFNVVGWKQNSDLGSVFGFINNSTGVYKTSLFSNYSDSSIGVTIDAKKGEIVTVFGYQGTITQLRFYYAEGEI